MDFVEFFYMFSDLCSILDARQFFYKFILKYPIKDNLKSFKPNGNPL